MVSQAESALCVQWPGSRLLAVSWCLCTVRRKGGRVGAAAHSHPLSWSECHQPSLELVLGRAPAVLRNTESWLLNSISASRAVLQWAWKFKCVLLTSGRPNPMSGVLRRKPFPLIIFLVGLFHSHPFIFPRRLCCYRPVYSWF